MDQRTPFLANGGEAEDYAPARTWSDVKRVLSTESGKLWVVAIMVAFDAICQFGVSFMTIVFVGHLGEIELSAVSISLSVIGIFSFGCLLGMSSGLETISNQAGGAGDINLLGVSMQRGWIISLVSCLVFLPIYIFATPVLRLLGESEEVAVSAGEFTLLTIPQLFSLALTFPTTKFLIAQGKEKVVVMTFIGFSALVLHVFILWLFIIVFGWGTNGAALAFNITNWGTSISLIVYVVGWCNEGWSVLSWSELKGIWDFVGTSIVSAVMICLELWYMMSIIVLAGRLDNDVIAVDSLSICLNVNSVELMLFVGVNISISKIVGNELGKRRPRPRAAKYSVYVALFESLLVGIVFMVAVIIARDHFAIMFTSSQVLQRAVSKLAYLLGITMVLNGVQQVLTGVAIGIARQRTVAYINVACYFIFGIPFGYFLGYGANLGVMGLWSGMIAGSALQTICLMFLVYKIDWNREVEKTIERLQRSGGNGTISNDLIP